jgi:hypothetical protein
MILWKTFDSFERIWFGIGWCDLPLLDHCLHSVVVDCVWDLRRTKFELEIENSNKTPISCCLFKSAVDSQVRSISKFVETMETYFSMCV